MWHRITTWLGHALPALQRAFRSYFLMGDAEAPLSLNLVAVRVARAAALFVVLLAAFTVLRPSWYRRGNLALGRPAVSGSNEFGTTAAGAVDGQRYGQLGFHSNLEQPWLTIDLVDAAQIDRIDVYGRADCCFDQSLPLRIATSLDGKTFETLATLNTEFSQTEPWKLNVSPPVVARYVRLKTMKRSFLVLAEVEIFGKRP